MTSVKIKVVHEEHWRDISEDQVVQEDIYQLEEIFW
jgi:hypothetical protein